MALASPETLFFVETAMMLTVTFLPLGWPVMVPPGALIGPEP